MFEHQEKLLKEILGDKETFILIFEFLSEISVDSESLTIRDFIKAKERAYSYIFEDNNSIEEEKPFNSG